MSNASKLFFRLILILLVCKRMNVGMERWTGCGTLRDSPKAKLNAPKASAGLLHPQLPLCQLPNFCCLCHHHHHVDINTMALFGCDVYPRILSKSLLYPRIFLTSPLYRRIFFKVICLYEFFKVKGSIFIKMFWWFFLALPAALSLLWVRSAGIEVSDSVKWGGLEWPPGSSQA